MGCDIHGWVEKNVEGKWVAIKELHGKGQYRNYERFAALAGVRGNGPDPRGVPADVSDTAAHDIKSWAGDGHSHSWLPLKEAAQIFLRTRGTPAADDYESKYPASAYFGIEHNEENCRLVFWFDN